MTKVGNAAAEAARRAAEAMERARRAAEAAAAAAQRAAAAAQRAAAKATPPAPRPGNGASTFETAQRAPVVLSAQAPGAAPGTRGGIPAHRLTQLLSQDGGAGLALQPFSAKTLQDGTAAEPQALTGEVTVEPMTGDMTAGDAEELNRLAEEDPREAARRMEEMVANDPKYKDPAMVDALLSRSGPALAAINDMLGQRAEDGDLDDSGDHPRTRETLESLAFVTSRASPGMQQQVGISLANALPDGDLNQFDDILGELAAAGGEGAALYNAVFSRLSETKPAAAQQLEAERVEAATEAFNDAQEGIQSLNEELAALIGAAGPGLTQAEYDQLVANFKAEHADEYARFEAAGADLTALIGQNEDVLAHPENYDPALVEQVRGAVQELPELAKTEAGFEYLNSEMLAAGRGEPSLFDQLTPDATWIKSPSAFYEGLSSGLVEAAGLAMLKGRPEDAEAALNFLEARPHVFGLEPKEAKQLRRDLHAIHMGALRGHPPETMRQHFDTLRKHIDDFGISSKHADSLKVLGALAGLAGSDFSPESTSEAIRLALDSLGGFADLGAGGAGLLGSAGRIGKALGNVSLATGFITGVMDGMQAYAYARQGETDRAIASGLLAGGGIAPLAGAIMGFPGVGTLVGGLLLAGGAGLSWWANKKDQEEFQQQRLDALLAAGVPEDVAKVLVDADPYRMQQLQNAGFTPEQIRTMAEQYPGMLTGASAYPIDGVYNAVTNGAFTPDEVMKMLDGASQGGTDPVGTMVLLSALESAPSDSGRLDGGPTTREEWVELLRWAGENSPDYLIESDEGRAALERAIAALG